ncbi:hypothetical protein BGZ80_009199 [Entomortierella chlamydospora]|uniref:Little elongation complex subunit 2 C-terminal domain-containing protein n=1 Tax=Entomortierella chlamydospora TaxID=101097 RepID=A0A9P6T4P8_9FUNG|nr:hypothetical protein BGZ79_009951 [Entomortierella chlamydospora]KAG0023517.1 hypothetical protein BGZ80_009199 [Entomortierella chlamydospora]
MERRTTRRSNSIAATATTTVAPTTSPKAARGRGRGRGHPRGSSNIQGRGRPPQNTHGSESDSEAQNEQDRDQEQDQEGEEEHSKELKDKVNESGHSHSHGTISIQTKDAKDMDNLEENCQANSLTHDQSHGPEGVIDAKAAEEISTPSLIPSLIPSISTLKDESLEQDTPQMVTQSANATSSTLASASASASTPRSGVFFSEDLYNRVSASGTGRLSELFLFKKRQIDASEASRLGSSSEEAIGNATEGPNRAKKQRVSKLLGVRGQSKGVTPSESSNSAAHTQISNVISGQNATASASSSSDPTHVTSSGAKFDISDLVASVTSYVPEIASALHNVQIQKPNTDHLQQQQQQQQQQQPSIIQMKPADTRFYHPCIHVHDSRSALSREEHRRYLMYDAIARGLHRNEIQLQMGPEDRALWATLQEKVDQERQSVRQWQAEAVRTNIAKCFNSDFQEAMETKFRKARARVQEEYPQHYEFVHSIGLRLPGVPSTANSVKEPILNRKKADSISLGAPDSATSIQPNEPDPRGILKRTGKICPVSLAKPTWPTNEDGVPYEKAIEINDKYWITQRISTEPSSTTKARMSEQDYRRTHFPSKIHAPSVSKDPTVKQFVKEQNVHIALAASSLVELAKTLPSLASEWEIPVRVVLEEDHEGVMQKRVYVDKPLLRKKMSRMEIMQSFYDGVLKKLSLVGSSSVDANVLASSSLDVGSEPLDPPTKESNNSRGDPTPSSPPKESSEQVDTGLVDTSLEPAASKESEPESSVEKINEEEEEEGILGSRSILTTSNERNDGFEYSLWTFGETRILIRSRIHGYLNNSEPYRQVVLKSVIDYAPDVGPSEPGRTAMVGWWMAAWIRDDRLVALGRVDITRNQFVRYPDPKNSVNINPNPENPLGGVFSDLPAISIMDVSTVRAQDRGDWIKPSMRLIHYILGKLMLLGPGQYILGHKRHDINANIYKAVQEIEEPQASTKEKPSSTVKGHYDLHAAHKSSPQPLNENGTEGANSSSDGGLADEDLQLRWVGTPDQIPGTFPYNDEEPKAKTRARGKKGKRGK